MQSEDPRACFRRVLSLLGHRPELSHISQTSEGLMGAVELAATWVQEVQGQLLWGGTLFILFQGPLGRSSWDLWSFLSWNLDQ